MDCRQGAETRPGGHATVFEPTTLAATTTALVAALESCGCDARLVFARAGLDYELIHRPGARFPFAKMRGLWTAAREASGDPCIALTAARWFKPQALHALGLSWMTSQTLLDGFLRMSRYARIASTGLRIAVRESNHEVRIVVSISAHGIEFAPEAIDAALAYILSICRQISTKEIAPLRVTYRRAPGPHTARYVDYFAAPVLFGQRADALHFDAKVARARVPSGNEEVAREIDRIAERYLATLQPSRVQDKVREILVTLLPSGAADQRTIARNLHRSVSTLQRQLKSEGSSFRKVLDETRQSMAERLVKEGEYSLGQIAYLLGFSDPANFSRAFRRWTGGPPTGFR
jgi:AraC-like DNA-binding protein